MRKFILPVALISALGIGQALAQSSSTTTTDEMNQSGSSTTAPSTGSTSGSSDTGATTGTTGSTMGTTGSASGSAVITQQEAAAWVGKAVYDNAGNQIGEVAAVTAGSGGNVSEIHVDVGGFLGIGETRVKVMPEQISMQGDRLVVNMASDQVNALPKVDKSAQ